MGAQPPRRGLAIIANSHTPYREHVHRRIAREIPQLRLWTVFTHETSDARWRFDVPAEIGPVSFGPGQPASGQASPRHALREWRKGGRIIEFLKQQDVRAVVVLGYNDLGRVRILRWCRRHGIPTFLWGDSNIKGDLAAGPRRVVKNWLVPRLLRLPTGVLACGRLGAAYFERYGVAPDRIFLFPNEPDYDLIRRLTPEQVGRVGRRFGLTGGPAGRRRIIYSGRLVPVKRVDLLVEAFIGLADRRPDWDLVIAGDGPERPNLEGRLPAALKSRVTFTDHLADQSDVSALYRLSDVLALPSAYEPWALVVNEAVAAGLAVVSSSVVGAAAELVRDGVNGRVFPPGDREALAACLLDVTDPARTDAMKRASPEVLADWRRRADPVRGLEAALRSCGVLNETR